MRAFCLGLVALGAATSIAAAQTGYTISGAMSNFDCGNHCDYPCDEMEVQIEGIHPEDVLHTYRNSNYGVPTVTLSPDGTYTIVDYRNPQHSTGVNSIEHFGITIRGAVYYGPAPYHPTRVHWYRGGQLATVHGQVPVQGGGTAPATQPVMPSISAAVTPGSHGQGGVTLTVTNNDATQAIWVKRRAQVSAGAVTLEALMPNDPVVTGAVQIDASPVRLAASQSMTVARDLVEIEEEQSAVFSAQYYQNIVGVDPFGPNSQDTPGPELGNIMTATIASPQLACAHSMPTITSQPPSVTMAAGGRVDLRVQARGDDVSPLTYVWMKEGVVIGDGNGISGTTGSRLRIDPLTAAAEGFYSVRVTNECATVLSDSALVFISGHNDSPTHGRPCPADFNGTGGLSVQDIFDYLAAYFAGGPAADFNGVGGVSVQDIFDFLAGYFAGC